MYVLGSITHTNVSIGNNLTHALFLGLFQSTTNFGKSFLEGTLALFIDGRVYFFVNKKIPVETSVKLICFLGLLYSDYMNTVGARKPNLENRTTFENRTF